MIPRHLFIGIAAMLITVATMTFYVRESNETSSSRFAGGFFGHAPNCASATGPTRASHSVCRLRRPGYHSGGQRSDPLPSGRQQRAEELLRALMNLYLDRASTHPLAVGLRFGVFTWLPWGAVIDTNAIFADGHRSGVLVEELTVASIIQTLAGNIPGVLRVRILVDGKERETLAGHADLSDFYETSAVSQLVQQLQVVP